MFYYILQSLKMNLESGKTKSIQKKESVKIVKMYLTNVLVYRYA